MLSCRTWVKCSRLQVTCPKGHLSQMELCRFRNLTLTLTLSLTAYPKWPFGQVNCPQCSLTVETELSKMTRDGSVFKYTKTNELLLCEFSVNDELDFFVFKFICQIFDYLNSLFMPSPYGKAIKRWWPSAVCPSVRPVPDNREWKGLASWNLAGRKPVTWVTRDPI